MLQTGQVDENWSLEASSGSAAGWGGLALDVISGTRIKPHIPVTTVLGQLCPWKPSCIPALPRREYHCQNSPFQRRLEAVRCGRRAGGALCPLTAQPCPGTGTLWQVEDWEVWRIGKCGAGFWWTQSWKPELSVRPSTALTLLSPSTTLSPASPAAGRRP